ncbi:MAG: hypothetical protein K9J27_05050 [Bacteroidales bacterium]|nr:hypothetical protein [Bacteroidales bacterium]MCF8333073.1 hypothetical protein [Bacteroidales bacterium]
MKKLRKIFIITVFVLISGTITSQTTEPPDPPGNPTGSGDTPVGGEGAPIGGGIALLLAMGAAYGGKKYYDYRKKIRNEINE